MHPWAIYALEVTHDRERATQQARLESEFRATRVPAPSRLRRPAAIVLAALSRGSAVAARRLDECVADDLGRALAPAK